MSISVRSRRRAARPFVQRLGQCVALALSLSLATEAAWPVSVAFAQERGDRRADRQQDRLERRAERRAERRDDRFERRGERRDDRFERRRERMEERRADRRDDRGGGQRNGAQRDGPREGQRAGQGGAQGARQGGGANRGRDTRQADAARGGARGGPGRGDGRGHQNHGRRDKDGSSGAVAAVLGIAAGAALLAILADRPEPVRRGDYRAPPPPDYGRPYHGQRYHGPTGVGAPPGAPLYDLPGGGSGALAAGYVWIAAGAQPTLDAAMDLALDVTERGLPAQVYRSRAGDFVVVVGAAEEWRARDEIRYLADGGRIPGAIAFLTDGRGLQRRMWAAPDVLADERAGGGRLSRVDYR